MKERRKAEAALLKAADALRAVKADSPPGLAAIFEDTAVIFDQARSRMNSADGETTA